MRTDRNKLIIEIQDNFIPCSGIFSDPFEKEAHEIATYIAHYLDPQTHESHQFGRYVAQACRAIIRNSSMKHAPEGWDIKDLHAALIEVAECAERLHAAEEWRRDADKKPYIVVEEIDFNKLGYEGVAEELRRIADSVADGCTAGLTTAGDRWEIKGIKWE